MFDLPAEGTGRKSFYGKAKIIEDGNTATLYSYNTPVAKIVDGKFEELKKAQKFLKVFGVLNVYKNKVIRLDTDEVDKEQESILCIFCCCH